MKRVILFSIIPFLLLCFYDYIQYPNSFSKLPLLVEFLSFLVFLIYFFYEKMNTVVNFPLYLSIKFWIAVGLFLYFAGNFFFFLFVNSVHDNNSISQMLLIYRVVTITKNLLLSFAFFATEIKSENNSILPNIPEDINLDSFHPKNTYS